MDRLRALSGGQPLRTDDWKFIQDATIETISSLVRGLSGSTGACIIWGLEITIDLETLTISVTEGVFFTGNDLCWCSAASFVYHGGSGEEDAPTDAWVLYLLSNTTYREPRAFRDPAYSESVYESRDYELGYGATVPQVDGTLSFPSARLIDLITGQVTVPDPPVIPVQYMRYFATSFSSVWLYNVVTLLGAPGDGKAIKVLSLSARIVPTTPLDVGGQQLNVCYGDDGTVGDIGSFPASFLHSVTEIHRDMTPVHDTIYENTPVRLGLSGEMPASGLATIHFYCYYTIITL